MNKKRAIGTFQTLRNSLTPENFSLHPLFFLQPVVSLIAGYFMVGRPFPLTAKIAVFLLICLATAWLMYRFIMRPSSHSQGLYFEDNFPESRREKTHFITTILKIQY